MRLITILLCFVFTVPTSPLYAQRLDGPTRAAGIPFRIDLSPGFKGGDKAIQLWSDGKRQEALKLLQQSHATGAAEQRRRLMVGAILLELKRPGPAAEALATVDARLPEVRDHVLALQSQALIQAKRPDEALQALDALPADSPLAPRAIRLAARSELDRNRPGSAILALNRLIGDRPLESLEPATLLLKGEALMKLGTAEGEQEAMRHFRAIRLHAPLSGEARTAMESLRALAARGISQPEDTLAEKVGIANAYFGANLNEEAIKRFQPLFDKVGKDVPLRCEIAYNLGKALQNLRRYTDAEPALEVAGEVCDRDRMVKALYVLGRGSVRKSDLAAAEKALRDVATRFPDHSYADDALFLLGVSFQDKGELDKGIALLEEQIRTWPAGDMRGEATWRLAWGAYRQGKLEQAVARVESLLADARQAARLRMREIDTPALTSTIGREAGAGPVRAPQPSGEPTARPGNAEAAEDEDDLPPPPNLSREAYWRARWLYLKDPGRTGPVVEAYETLIRYAPTDFYSILAYQRLQTLAPQRAKALLKEASRIEKPERMGFALEAQPLPVRRAVELLRAGLKSRAVAELAPLIPSARDSGDLALSYLLEAAERFDLSHGIVRGYLARNGQTRIDAQTRPAFLMAFPPAFEEEIRAAATKEGVDPMLLMSLAREESAFDPQIRSWAGATGLVQLMEPTAQMMARELKKKGKISASDLTDPALNLELSAHYVGNLLAAFSNHPGLVIPSYNAGEGAVGRWLKQRGNLPFDEFVEEIPYKQTRDYTKRVLGSYQTYHYLYRADARFIKIDLKIPTERRSRGKNEEVP